MKKVIALILAAITILAIAALSGCGNKTKPENTTPVQSNQTTTPTSPTQTDPITDPTQTTPDQTTASEPNIEPTTASEPTVTTEPTTAQTEPTTAQTEPTTVQTEPTTESTQATTDPYIDHTHVWDEGTVTKKVSYTENGEITYRCIDCGATKTESVPMLKVEVEVVEEWDTPKLFSIKNDFYLVLENGTKEFYHLLIKIEPKYVLENHKTYKANYLNGPESTGTVKFEHYVKGNDGKYYQYTGNEDNARPGRESINLSPAGEEAMTVPGDYEGYVLIHCYSSKGEDLGYTIRYDTVWHARMSESDFS